MDGDIPFDAPRPRLCHLRKRSDFTGYGFNLHAEKGKSGQFIGKVDEGSPAELAGLKEGDRIIEVNGTNVSSENHQQVVQRIKTVPDETKFLVVDRVADDYYREKKIVVKGDMTNILVIETPLLKASGINGSELSHRARLCHLKIWPDFAGYGFNLHAEKGKSTQYIGKVDPNSPAEAAGLREHDRIVEVNGFNVSAESHQDVVKRIKSDPTQMTLLVVDRDADAYFEREGIIPSSQMHNVDKIVCPDTKPCHDVENGSAEQHDNSGTSLDYEAVADEIANIAENAEREQDSAAEVEDIKQDRSGLSLNVAAASASTGSMSSSSMTPTPIESPKSPVVVGGIEFAGTAEEARKKMSKKKNVKDDSLSLKAKYELFQKL